MPIISVRDHANSGWKRNSKKKTNKKTKQKKTKTEKNKGDGSYSKRVRAKWFCCAFKLGFLQLIYKSFLIFKSNFTNNLKSQETKSQIKAHLLYLANCYFYKYNFSPLILRHYCVLQNLRKNKNIIITTPDNGNGVVILDWKLYDNAIQKIFSDTSKFEKLNEDPTLKLHYNVFI